MDVSAASGFEVAASVEGLKTIGAREMEGVEEVSRRFA